MLAPMAVRRETVRTGWREAWGILLVALCVLGLLSLMSYRPDDIPLLKLPPNRPAMNFIGPVGAWLAFVLLMVFGLVGYLVPVAAGVTGLFLVFKREGRVWTKAVWMAGIVLALACLLELDPDAWEHVRAKLNITGSGGEIGHVLAQAFLIRFLGVLGTAILSVATLIVFVVLLIEIHPVNLFQRIAEIAGKLWRRLDVYLEERRDKRTQIEHEEREVAKRRRRLEELMREQAAARQAAEMSRQTPRVRPAVLITRKGEGQVLTEPEGEIPPPEPEGQVTEPEAREARPAARRERRPPPRSQPEPEEAAALGATARVESHWTLPPMDLLDPMPPEKDREIKGDFQASAGILKETLAEFGVEVDVTNVERGPVVTRYELLPAPGVRVEKIVALGNNIALAMKAESVRIQAPIPGKGVVGIEVPNPKTTLVCLREVLESDAWLSGKAELPLALAKDVGGRVLVPDLGEMPHGLIGGATGSGKTICMNSLLAGLLMSRTPDEMRLMLIDPKIVEFSVFNHLPHLVVPVITDPKKVAIGLRWAINEMEKRYKLFARVGVRNIKAYNDRSVLKQAPLFEGVGVDEEEERESLPPARLPYVVIVVDELADLMLVAQVDIENGIARLAQLSRAVGIHMILATQRPSVNVITGTIKANFPARIAFQVAQKVDSRTILDANGADKLLGKGDMLFLPPGTSRLVRAQGTMTTDAEIRRIVEFWKQQGQPHYELSIKEKIERTGPDLPEVEEDELLEAAMEIIRQTRRASTSALQRRLRIGYTRAARLMDLLEDRGIVGPPRGSDPREILIDLDGEIPQNRDDDLES